MIWMDVDTALSEVPVNVAPLTDDTDFKTIETAVAYNAAGMALYWHFVTTAGAYTATAVTPTTAGTYDWAHQQQGMYTIEIPASGGASINNDTEGFGWFTGFATGVLPWRGPTIGFRAVALNDALIDGGDNLDVNVTQFGGTNATTSSGRPEVNTSHIAGSAVSTSSAQIGVNVINAAGTAWGSGAITAASIAAAALNGKGDWNVGKTGYSLSASQTFDVTGNITGNLSGSVGSVTGAVGSVTGNVGGSVASVTASVTVGTNNDKTGYALSATGSAALTEGYAALGAAATLPQLLYEVRALLAEKSYVSTTLTTKKLDGTTTAATYTLDDATTPTSITRAT